MERPLATNPSIDDTIVSIREVLKQANFSSPKLSLKERLGIFIVLMQFSMYLPYVSKYFRADYREVCDLYNKITTGHAKSLAEVLALGVSMKHDALEAIWLVLVTSRMYARWYDEESLLYFLKPSLSAKKRMMNTYYQSVLAIKTYKNGQPQDSGGDTYYVWTHAIAHVLYGPLSPWWSLDARFFRFILSKGTWLNHSIAHKLTPQTMPSDHTLAAQYGNAIGTYIAYRFAVEKQR